MDLHDSSIALVGRLGRLPRRRLSLVLKERKLTVLHRVSSHSAAVVIGHGAVTLLRSGRLGEILAQADVLHLPVISEHGFLRNLGLMPPLGATVGSDEDVKDTAHYVLKLAGRTHDGLRAYRGKAKYDTICAACHGPQGKGNRQIGAPNLTDEIWLHGGSEAFIVETITKGRKSLMPEHKAFLDEGKIHLLSAYVYGLSAAPAQP